MQSDDPYLFDNSAAFSCFRFPVSNCFCQVGNNFVPWSSFHTVHGPYGKLEPTFMLQSACV